MIMDVAQAKLEMRSRIRAARLALRRGEAQTRSGATCHWVINSPEFKSAKTIALYRAMPGELITDSIFTAAIAMGITVLYPRVEQGKKDLVFCVIHRLEDMVAGGWGILEPPQGADIRPVSEANLVITPGVAFDRKGGRIGQGGGYYDRVFQQLRPWPGRPGAVRMGIAYTLQVVDEIPREPHDEVIDCLAIESGIIRFSVSGGETCY
jgi:5-formyltetrahydrofolate cyclo-ligase